MCPTRLSQVTPCGGSSLKQNIFEQAFTWYPIRHFISSTTRNIQLLNSSDFSETPGIYKFSGTMLDYLGLVHSLPNEWKNRQKKSKEPILSRILKNIISHKRGNKYIYNMLIYSKYI